MRSAPAESNEREADAEEDRDQRARVSPQATVLGPASDLYRTRRRKYEVERQHRREGEGELEDAERPRAASPCDQDHDAQP